MYKAGEDRKMMMTQLGQVHSDTIITYLCLTLHVSWVATTPTIRISSLYEYINFVYSCVILRLYVTVRAKASLVCTCQYFEK